MSVGSDEGEGEGRDSRVYRVGGGCCGQGMILLAMIGD